MLIPAITFGIVFAIALGAYWLLIVRPESETQRALDRRLRGMRQSVLKKAPAGLLKEERRLSELPALERVLGSAMRVSGPMQRMLNQSGLSWNVGTLVLVAVTCALLGYLLSAWFLRAPLVGIPLGLIAGYLPFAYVSYKRKSRIVQFEEQFPEAIDLLARALRAGHAFTTALEMAGNEMPDPVGVEFRLMYDRQNFGMAVPDTLKDFAERVPLIDAKFFATAVLTQREAGGNLSEVLDNLASVIRERFKVKRQVRVITAHGRMTGWVLSAMPPFLALALFLLNPNHIKILVNDPLGVQMIAGAITLQVVGTLVIRKLVNIEY